MNEINVCRLKFLAPVLLILVLSQLGISVNVNAAVVVQNLQKANVENLFPYSRERIDQVIEEVSSYGSRMTGYSGYYKTLNYLSNFFSELGIPVLNHTYKVLVPYDEETFIETLEPFTHRINAYALYPNGINPSSTPSEGVVGNLIYVRSGELEDFDGKNVAGSIVAMDFNSKNNWLKAANLGAQAVIFIEPDQTTYQQCDAKYLDTPIGFPRVYVKKTDWEVLKKASKIRIVTRVSWREVEAKNIVGIVNGTDNPNEVVILSAHFDSWSVVPELAASKTELLPVSLLLEYARYLKTNPPKYTVWLVLYSGHWQALAGAREFVEDFFFSKDVQDGRIVIRGNIHLDLMASDTDGLQFLHSSEYTTYGAAITNFNRDSIHSGGFPGRLSWFITTITSMISEEPVASFVIKQFMVSTSTSAVSFFFSTREFHGTESIPFMLDSEIVSISGIPAFSITTRHSGRVHVGAPIDDGKYADTTALDPYFQTTLYIIDRLLRMNWGVEIVKPTRRLIVSARGYPGYAFLYGTVKTYNFSKGWYDPVPNALVEVRMTTSNYKLNKIILKASENGSFIVHGIPISGAAAGGGTQLPFSRWVVRGWVLDDEGDIVMATDMGQFGMSNFKQEIIVLHEYENVTVVIAKVVTLEVLDFEIPTTFTTPSLVDPRAGAFEMWKGLALGTTIIPCELHSKSMPIIYGSYSNGWEPAAVIWIQPDLRFVIASIFNPSGVLLTNSSLENSEGNGFYVEYGSKVRINFAALRIAEDFYYVSYGRYLELNKRHIGSPSIDEGLKKAGRYINEAKNALNNLKYSEAYTYALVARAYAAKVYGMEVMPLINDSASSLLYMFLLIIFGSFFLEKILIRSRGPKRLIYIGALASIFLAIFSLLHPAFGLMSNISLGMMGSLILIVLLATIIVLLSISEELRSSIEKRILGVHRVEISRLDTATVSFSLGSEHMRRRPFRAILVFITIITVVTAMISFTSLTPSRVSKPVTRYGYPSDFTQILIKNGRGVPPDILSDKALDVAKMIAGETYYVFPRAWVYAPLDRFLNNAFFRVYSTRSNVTVSALLGLTQEELRYLMTQYGDSLNLTTARADYEHLLDEKFDHAIISSSLAENLNVTLGDIIYMSGIGFKIVGIAGSTRIDFLLEADGWNMFPADPTGFSSISRDRAVSALGGVPSNLGIARVIIIPYKRALEIGGYTASIAIVPREDVSFEEMLNLAREFAYSTDLTTYISKERRAVQLSTFRTIVLGGWEIILILIVLGALNIFTAVLGSLRERTREVYVFSIVGLSPMGIIVFFITEVLVYAIIGALIGYISGYFMTRIFIFAGILPSEQVFNFASAFTALSTLITMVTAIAAAAYPAYIASQAATPSLERRWKFKTKPKDDEWKIPLLISMSTIEEGRGLLAYLHEYYSGSGSVKEGVHMVRELQPPDYEKLSLSITVSLSPFEVGVSQKVDIAAVFNEKINRYEVVLLLKRLSGPQNTWITSNYRFIDNLRKQLIMWGSFSASEKEKYISKAAA
ncbi:MAG: M28 family peptidase [Thermoproteota archaeon]